MFKKILFSAIVILASILMIALIAMPIALLWVP